MGDSSMYTATILAVALVIADEVWNYLSSRPRKSIQQQRYFTPNGTELVQVGNRVELVRPPAPQGSGGTRALGMLTEQQVRPLSNYGNGCDHIEVVQTYLITTKECPELKSPYQVATAMGQVGKLKELTI